MISYIKDVQGKGRGVFASRDIKAGEVIEVAPVVVIGPGENQFLDKTELTNYYYDWENGCSAIPAGNGLLYNHSYAPNVRYIKNFSEKSISYVALRDIAKDEELVMNYNGVVDDLTPIWFHEKVVDNFPKRTSA